METNYHKPVLLKESVDGLNIQEEGIYVDVTFGGGGHSTEILKRLGPEGRLVAFDQDEEALANAPKDPRFTLLHENFRYIRQFLKFYGIRKVNGILADFGVSSHQFDSPHRGFSTRFDGELDMRMSRDNTVSAHNVINTYPQEKLRKIFADFGELRNAGAIASVLVKRRKEGELNTTGQLVEALKHLAQRGKENKMMAQIFQAIRIEVNQEISAIREFLEQVPDLLVKGGRLSIISYHSLEDRLVKRYIRSGKFEGDVEKDFYGNPIKPLIAIGKLIVPDEEEINRNSRARSARLRIAEKN